MTLLDFEKAKQPLGIAVELHRHGATKPIVYSNVPVSELDMNTAYEYDVVNCAFEKVSWTHSVSAPFESLSISMRFTGRTGDPHFENEMSGPGNSSVGLPIPQISDWVVLRTFNRHSPVQSPVNQTVFLARIHTARGLHQSDQSSGFVDKSSVQIQAEGFFDFLGKNHVCVGHMPTRGSLYNIADWISVKTSVLEEMLDGGGITDIVARRFEILFNALAKVKLPSTLGGQTIASSVNVIKSQTDSNFSSGGRWRRNCEAIPGYRLQGIQNLDPSNGSVLDCLLGSFMADPSMMEIFPSIELGNSSSPHRNKKINRVLSDNENLAPVVSLIVRMKPWRPESITKFAQRTASLVTNVAQISPDAYKDDSFKQKVLEIAMAEAGGVAGNVTNESIYNAQVAAFNELATIDKNLPSRLFGRATWPESPGVIGSEKMHFLEPSEIFSISYEQNDAAHVNTVSARGYRQASSQLEFASAFMGLPYTNTTDINEFGVRYYRPEWPFYHIQFGETQTTDENVDERGFIRAVAAAALQIHGAASRFLSGQVQCAYRPDIRTGMCFKAGHEIQNDGASFSDDTKESLSPGGFSQGGQLIGYVESITHDISTTNLGGVQANSSISYKRGLFNENIPPVGLSPEQKILPGSDVRNGWHQRFIGFTHLRRYQGGFTKEDFGL